MADASGRSGSIAGTTPGRESPVRDQADTLDLIADHAPLDRTLGAVCAFVERHLPGACALVITSDADYPLRVFHQDAFSDPVVESLSLWVRAWLDRTPVPAVDGTPAVVDDPTDGGEPVWCLPIVGLGARPLGALCVRWHWSDEPSADDTSTVRQASRLAQIAIEHHLTERQVVGLLAAERKQIAADLHDDPVQAVTAVSLILQRLAMVVPAEQSELVGQARTAVDRAIERMRRMLFELHPSALEEEGLAVAVEVYLEETFDPLDLRWTIDAHLHDEPDVHVAALTYRLIHEALANVVAHAGASKVTVELTSDVDGLTARITDDGCGFDPDAVPPNRPGHLGLHAASDLARRASGGLDIDSAPGRGCTVTIWLPLAAPGMNRRDAT